MRMFENSLANTLQQQWPNTITRRDAADVTVTAQLATRVPELCATCTAGTTRKCCPDCPTIGKLLAIGAAVMSRKIDTESPSFDGYSLGMVEDWTDGANWMLAALRTVQP